MEKVGFSIFGRPVEHEFKSNGLFNDLSISEQTYLALPGRGELKNGDNLTLILRENFEENEVIKVFSYDYAVSFNNRPGCFVGSGIAFRGIPTPKLLYGAYKAIHSEASKLLDAQNKFKDKRFISENIKLIPSSTDGLINGNSLLKTNKIIKTGSAIAVKIDGPIQNHLMSVVQGFMFNPSYRSVEKLYVSSNQQLLVDCIGNDKIYGIQQLLDFSDHFKSQYESIGKLKKEREELEGQIKSLQIDADRKNNKLNELRGQITDEGKKKNNLDSIYGALKKEVDRQKIEKDKLTKELEQAKNAKNSTFEGLLKSPHFQKEKSRYEEQFMTRIKYLENENKELKHELEASKNRPVLNQKSALYLGLFSAILLFGSGFIGYKLKGRRIVAEQEITTDGPSLAVNENNGAKAKVLSSAPKEFTLSDFFNLTPEEIINHKNSLDVFISEVENTDSKESDLSNFFSRKWNFAEVIDYDAVSIDNGLVRLKRIKKIYDKHNKNKDFFEKNYMLDGFTSYRLESFEFSTSKRNEILNKYLSQPNNVYASEGLSNIISSNIENTHPLLYMHFRWMVYMNSEHTDENGKTKDADILKTNKTRHVVLLK